MKPKLCIFAVALLNLLAGGSIGFVVGRCATAPRAHVEPARDPELPSLANEIGLDVERAARVRDVLASCGPRFEEAMKDARPRVKAVHEQLMAELQSILSKEELGRLHDAYVRRYGMRPPHGG